MGLAVWNTSGSLGVSASVDCWSIAEALILFKPVWAILVLANLILPKNKGMEGMRVNMSVKNTLACLVLPLAVACGGGGDGGDDSGSGSTTPPASAGGNPRQVDVTDAINSLGSAIGKGLVVANSSNARVVSSDQLALTQSNSATLNCDASGTTMITTFISIPDESLPQNEAEIATTPIPFDVTAASVFNQCDGLDGTFDFTISGVILGESFEFSSNITGLLTQDDPELGRCVFTFDNLDISGSTTGPNDPGTTSVSGSLNASCGDQSLNCSFNNVDTSKDDALQNSCS